MSLMKGAFVVFQTPVPVPTDIIVFQFNAETLTRKFTPPQDNAAKAHKKGGGSPTHQTRRPVESFGVTIDLDASDQLATGNAIATAVGLHPALAQLELLLYPQSAMVLVAKAMALAGSPMVVPNFTPMVLFVWGTTRLLPVRVTSLQIVEQQFDNRLNPINAKVDVGLTVLDEDELKQPFKTIALVNHIGKEAMSRIGTVQSALDVKSLLPF